MQPSEEEQRVAEVDLERIRKGGIPVGVEQRLKRIASASQPFFTSDLTAKEHALTESSGFEPIAQVMGSSVVQHGWGDRGRSSMHGEINEMPAISGPWNLARNRAFGRLAQEAQLARADAVLGIEVNVTGNLGDADNVEYVVFGTAVRKAGVVPDPAKPRTPNFCTLSGQDVTKLMTIGAAVIGVVGYTSVVAVGLSAGSNNMINLPWDYGYFNEEIPEIGKGLNAARQRAFAHIDERAKAVRANDVVISTLERSIDHHVFEVGQVKHHVFIISVHVLGTTVRLATRETTTRRMIAPSLSIDLRR